MPDSNPYAAPEFHHGTAPDLPRGLNKGDPRAGCYLGAIGGGLMALGFLVIAVIMVVASIRQGADLPLSTGVVMGGIAFFAFAAIPVGFLLVLIASFQRWLAGRGG